MWYNKMFGKVGINIDYGIVGIGIGIVKGGMYEFEHEQQSDLL
jgi:hypothetical protein